MSFAMPAADDVQVNDAVGTSAFDASNPCACSVAYRPRFSVELVGVTATLVTVGGAVTVTVACANVPFDVAVAFSVAVPVAVGVTVTVAPLVVLSGAIVESVVVHVNAVPGIATFDASKASATNCCVWPVWRLALDGVIVT